MSRNKSGQGKKKRSRSKSSRAKKNNTREYKKSVEVTKEVKQEQPAAFSDTEKTADVVETDQEPVEQPVETEQIEESKVIVEEMKTETGTDKVEETIDEPEEMTEEVEEQAEEPEEIVEEPVEQEPVPEETTEETEEQAEEPEEIVEEPVEQDDAEPEEPEEKHYAQPAPKKHRTGLKVFAVMVMLIAYSAAFVSGAFAVEKYIVNPDRFHKGTIINGVDVSGKNIEDAKKALKKEWNKHSITVVDTDGNKIGEIKNFDFDYKIDKQLEACMKPGAEIAISRFVSSKDSELSIRMKPKKSTASFKKQFESLDMVKNAVGDKPSKNAYIDKSDTEFRIVKEVIGNSVDTKMLRKAIFEAISRGEETFEYRSSSFHKAPAIVSTSQVLLDELDYCKKYLSFKLRLRNSVGDYTVTPDWLDKMFKVDDNGRTRVSEESVNTFISDVLYPKFSSTGDTRRLRSAGGGKYTVSGGTYGFTVDADKEREVLTKELKEREDVEREPYYSGKKPNKNGVSDIGDDFVEVSIEKQEVWVVKGGKVVVDTPVVTGNVPRHNTPTGVYYIVYKATNTTLKGHNDDGSEYESHVAYWMPFYLGYGLHDANWRGVFGGTIYIGNGSHGCVNCPPAIMPKIFSECYEGMPVIVH